MREEGQLRYTSNFVSLMAFHHGLYILILNGSGIIAQPIIRLAIGTQDEVDSRFSNAHRKSKIVSKQGYPCDRVYSDVHQPYRPRFVRAWEAFDPALSNLRLKAHVDSKSNHSDLSSVSL